ncbi:hypothetical protein AAKU52_002353 [Pedobacter sp. CG_S7]|uniref:hypothetical protein n=1 Tax=Pedobacter sp. CG_S7 TaxID=3143930 RepID=UPI003398A89B
MIAPTNIHPPKNWQDFETLCLKLWGEIWQIPHDIEFNSDNAQGQHGVDIYGPTDGGKCYKGIQCKNKKLNLINGLPNRISISDVQAEIDKARDFKPALKKLVIATSLPKDQKVEEYVRIKSAEYAQQNLFTIQICFWEFIERKLTEFPKVHDWYLKNEDFQRPASMDVNFSSGERTKHFYPKFQKTIERFTAEKPPAVKLPNTTGRFLNGAIDIDRLMENMKLKETENKRNMQALFPRIEWHQHCWLKLLIKNTGQRVIEDFKIKLVFEGDFLEVGAESRNGVFNQHFRNNVKEYSNSSNSLYIQPSHGILVQGDSFFSGSIYIQPLMDHPTEIKIYWHLLARDFEDTGVLDIRIDPKYHIIVNNHYVSSIEEEKESTNISLIQRLGSFDYLRGTTNFSDKESDYMCE